ncbi:PASTA domain-containing protein [Anaerorudis cellulosivorans]|uniref:PASTA domain-containing protein n=1 Tax=Anaerorudis cellulosivorans TaxID=3397862 RepID=UPI00221EA4E0|nr:PASTA domain-containing protein [Seramator thermalis]MCW1734407.1 PASTA domain-containing protein [Seramator thermalis]
MNAKQPSKRFFENSIIKNLLLIVLVSVVLLILTLLFLKVYTRHDQNVSVPKLAGLQVEEANAILKSKGLHIEIIDSVYQKDAVPGAIIEQVPEENSKVKKGRAIYVAVYAKTPQQVTMPELVDYSLRQAQALLISMGFTQLSIEEVPSEYSGLVLGVEYRGRKLMPNEKVPAGSPLKLIVGNGQLTDSLGMTNEYIMSPDQISARDSGDIEIKNRSVSKQQKNTNIDESFF